VQNNQNNKQQQMKKIHLIPILFILLACNSMKNSGTSNEAKSNLYTLLYSSNYQGRDEESNVVITNEKELTTLFQSVGNEQVPKVDFTKNQVVALFLGSKNTGGYSISIDRAEVIGNQIMIYKKIETPKGGMVTTAFTNPFVIVTIHNKKEIVFK
jgi:hypothetical protein